MQHSSSRARHAAAIFIVFCLIPGAAQAAKDYCRTIELTGAAGPASTDKVELQVTDYVGNVLDRSCQITVAANECADALALRLVATWGNGAQGGQQAGSCVDQGVDTTCGKTLDYAGTDPDVPNIFCKHRYRAGKLSGGKKAAEQLAAAGQCPQPPPNGQKAAFGEFKKVPRIEVCCYELDPAVLGDGFQYQNLQDCTGKKLGTTFTSPQKIEVSVFDRIDRPNVSGDGLFFEPKLPDNTLDVPVGFSSRQISLDPIGFVQPPSAKGIGCRADVARGASALNDLALDLML